MEGVGFPNEATHTCVSGTMLWMRKIIISSACSAAAAMRNRDVTGTAPGRHWPGPRRSECVQHDCARSAEI